MKCNFCPSVTRDWHLHEGFIYCAECYVLLVITFEHQPIKETINGRY